MLSEIPIPSQMPELDAWGEGKRSKSDLVRRAALRQLAQSRRGEVRVAELVRVILAETNLDYYSSHEAMRWLVEEHGLGAFALCDVRVVRAVLRPEVVARLLRETLGRDEAEIALTLMSDRWHGQMGEMVEAATCLAVRSA